MDRKSRSSKYVRKSDQKRSRYITSPVEKIISESVSDITRSGKESVQPKATFKTQEEKQVRPESTSLGNISFIKTDTVNTLHSLSSLGSGDSIKDIIISHWSSTSADAVISLYWSTLPINNITATVSLGRINSITRGHVVRLLTITIPHSTTMSLKDNGIIDSFNSLNKNIYFYAISSQTYTHWTIIK